MEMAAVVTEKVVDKLPTRSRHRVANVCLNPVKT